MGYAETKNAAKILGEDDLRRRDLGEYDTVTFKTFSATTSGLLMGGALGSLKAMWRYQQPKKNFEAVSIATIKMTKRYAITGALICGTYALADALIEDYRGKRNPVNSIYAGIVTGAVYGLRVGSIPLGCGAAGFFAASTALMDALGHTTKPRRVTDRMVLPYPVDE